MYHHRFAIDPPQQGYIHTETGEPLLLGLSVDALGTWFALIVIVAIGVQMLFQQERRRGDDRGTREPAMMHVDPATLRRVRPTTKRLTGTALIVAACIIMGAMRSPLFGLG